MFEAFNQNKMPTASQIRSGEATPDSIARTLKQSEGCVNCRCRKMDNLNK